MPRPRKVFPDYPRKPHQASGRARIVLDGKTIYLDGPFNSPESKQHYENLRAQRAYQKAVAAPVPLPSAGSCTVAEIAHAFIEATRLEQGRRQHHLTATAMRFLASQYGALPAGAFGAAELEEVSKAATAEQDCHFCNGAGKRGERACKNCGGSGRFRWCRDYCNKVLRRIKASWDWAVRRRLVPFSSLRSVRGIRRGLPGVRESKGVRSVPLAVVRQTQKKARRILADMIELQYLTGARPEEVCGLRRHEIRRDGVIPEVGSFAGVWCWEVHPDCNKNDWRGQGRVLFFGPRAQKILRRYTGGEFVFSPQEGARQRSIKWRPKLENNTRAPGIRYPISSYEHAIKWVCRKHGIPLWCPLQLRHTRATEIRSKYGPDAARVVLGHHLASVTGRYAESDLEKAAAIMAEIG